MATLTFLPKIVKIAFPFQKFKGNAILCKYVFMSVRFCLSVFLYVDLSVFVWFLGSGSVDVQVF